MNFKLKRVWNYLRIWLAAYVKPLRKWLLTEPELLRIEMMELRAMFSFFGHDASGMSDDDMLKGLAAVGELIDKCKLNKEQMIEFAAEIGKLDNLFWKVKSF